MTTRRRSVATVLLASVAMVSAVVVFAASPAAAHTGFESSSPADGDVVDEPVSEITLTFSGEATPAGEGFVVLDPTGTIREADEITSVDQLTWILRFDEPLAGGDVGVRWMVAAPDAHPIDGSFSFTVTAPTSIDEPQLQEETAPAATEEPNDAPEVTADEQQLEEEPTESEPATTEPESVEATAAPTGSEPIDLESFVDTSDATPVAADGVAAMARILSVLGAVLAIGGAAFAAFGLRGGPADVSTVLSWVRGGGVLLVIGAVAEAVAITATLAGQWSALTSAANLGDALWSSAGLAIALRAIGGFLAASKTTSNTMTASTGGDPVIAARQLASIGGGDTAAPPPEGGAGEPFLFAEDQRWDSRAALGGLVGVGLVAVSFMFDGHIASEGPRWLHAAANLAHVTAAAIWAGGVVMLALTIHRRRRDNRSTQALQLAMRFSVIATTALVTAGVAGTALSIIVIDAASDLWSTPWGRLLIAKVAVVAVAAAGGAYNHRVIVPALNQNPDDHTTIDRFRTVVTLEAAALFAVAIITAFLIAASST